MATGGPTCLDCGVTDGHTKTCPHPPPRDSSKYKTYEIKNGSTVEEMLGLVAVGCRKCQAIGFLRPADVIRADDMLCVNCMQRADDESGATEETVKELLNHVDPDHELRELREQVQQQSERIQHIEKMLRRLDERTLGSMVFD